MNLQGETRALEAADRDIETARRLIARQKTILRRVGDGGPDADSARELLDTMRDSLVLMEAHRVLILDSIDRMKRGLS